MLSLRPNTSRHKLAISEIILIYLYIDTNKEADKKKTMLFCK
jgi:hypothetical protein